jgi:polar amino acid transport system ATP-binding protein
MSTAVRLEGVTKRYGKPEVLRGVNLEIPAGQTVAIIGPSGSGKSTLLRLLMALGRPDAGRIGIAGEPLWTMVRNGREVPADERHVRRLRGKVGMVFQHFNLFPHMTALANVIEVPMRVRRLSRAEAEAQGVARLERVGLADRRNAYPAELSGGQKQRVAIARALAMEPEIMLFDEITSALDSERVGGILRLLDELARERRMTVLIVTHHLKFAERSSDRVVFFDQSHVLEDGPPERIFRDPREPRTRQFLDLIPSSEG